MTGTIAIVLKGYPRLSETFIAQEIHALERRGFELRLYALRHPTDTAVYPVHREIRAPVVYLPEYLGDEPRRVAAAWRLMVRKIHATVVHGRDQRAHAESSRPLSNAAMAKPNTTENPTSPL